MTKIIVVEDSWTVREMVTFALREAGYEVLEAMDEKDALRKLMDSSPDLMIADLSATPEEEREFIRAVRSGASQRSIPLVLVISEDGESRRGLRRTKGASAWIVKPFTPDQLIAVLRRVLP